MPPSTILRLSHRSFTPSLSQIQNSPSIRIRPFSQQPLLRFPRKDSQHKDSINTEATEYSKSGTDDQSARNEDAAFNPEVTDPEGEKDVAGRGNGEKSNPLDASPANQEISRPRGEQEGGAEKGVDGGGKQSGFGSGKKGGS